MAALTSATCRSCPATSATALYTGVTVEDLRQLIRLTLKSDR
jgi:hypothetical protein